eukprot:411154-Pelagomonas_calceolata.AAC.1
MDKRVVNVRTVALNQLNCGYISHLRGTLHEGVEDLTPKISVAIFGCCPSHDFVEDRKKERKKRTGKLGCTCLRGQLTKLVAEAKRACNQTSPI